MEFAAGPPPGYNLLRRNRVGALYDGRRKVLFICELGMSGKSEVLELVEGQELDVVAGVGELAEWAKKHCKENHARKRDRHRQRRPNPSRRQLVVHEALLEQREKMRLRQNSDGRRYV